MSREIYLIRHTTPDIAKGVCYGRTDIGSTPSLAEEAEVIRQALPNPRHILSVFSSPLQRCSGLARLLFPTHPIQYIDELMEIDCGRWEMKHWDELPPAELDPWMEDFVHVRIPGGESYLDLHERVTGFFTRISDMTAHETSGAVMLITHGGPIRSILSHLTGTALKDSFGVFGIHYGCVVRVKPGERDKAFEILSNPAPKEKEQHKPLRFYKRS